MKAFVTYMMFWMCTVSLWAAVQRPTTVGFYPVWENTGRAESAGDIYLGTGSGHVGIVKGINLGVAPILFAYRTPNAFIKSQFFQSDDVNLSAQLGFYHLLEGAGTSSMSPEYSSRFDNPDFTVTLMPMSLTGSYSPAPWFEWHQTLTGMQVFSRGPVQGEFSLSYSTWGEFLPRNRHALNVHWIYVGLWKHDNSAMGVSYRYRNTWTEFRLGYFYRFRNGLTQSNPLFSLAFLF